MIFYFLKKRLTVLVSPLFWGIGMIGGLPLNFEQGSFLEPIPNPTSQIPNPMTQEAQEVCPEPVLSRLKRHSIARGETLESIARQYNLIPATLIGMNPILRSGKLSVGQDILIPPFNGIQVSIPAGQTWQEVAQAYNARADVVFEVNGCQANPQVVFIPGVNWSPGGPVSPAVSILQGYPLPTSTSILFGYGWQLHPDLGKVVFHSGLDFEATVGTPVLSVGTGIVAFVGERGSYGNLVVVNHPSGKQTRYAHLSSIAVKVGQRVNQGEVLGSVGTTGQPDRTSPHLHFEIRYNSDLGWVAEDPNPYFGIRPSRSRL